MTMKTNKTYEHFDNGVKVVQLDDRYKFTMDSILLAKFCTVKQSDHVCEFCAGNGVISLHLYSQNPFTKLYFVEIQKSMCDLIFENINISNLTNKALVLNKDIKDLQMSDFEKKLDIVVCNPPYQKLNGNKLNECYEIAICRHELLVKFEDIVKSVSKIIKNKGKFYFMLPTERCTEAVLTLKKYNFEIKKMKFLFTNKDEAYLMLAEAVFDAKSGVKVFK